MKKNKKRKGFIKEFREFILRGNVADLATGVIIGVAFQAIINSAVNDLIMPVIGVITGGVDFSNKFIVIGKIPDGADVSTLEAARKAAPVFAYGSFVTAVINFLIMAFVIFLMVKLISKVREIGAKAEDTAEISAVAEKQCGYCRSTIDSEAVRCPFCTSELK